MHYDAFPSSPGLNRKIAVIGAGISGLGAAYFLSRSNRVTLYEAEPRLGGHARTLMAGRDWQVPVDTGFIVFNYRNYPHLTALFKELDVPVKKSDMSFAASLNDGQIEYGLQTLKALFSDKRNFGRPGFWRMIADIFKFNAKAVKYSDDPDMTLGQLLYHLNMGRWFRDYFLLPISGAIWSTSPKEMMDFPARSFTMFFENHGLLSINNQPQWFTVEGGSREYVARLEKVLIERGAVIRKNAPVSSVVRDINGATITVPGADNEHFDMVVFACHSDQALKMLADPSEQEQRVLSALRYQPNTAFLHDDPSQMPKRKACWSSWVYRGRVGQEQPAISVTYWMNKLQGIPEHIPLFVSLNPIDEIRQEAIFDQTVFYHPQFDKAAIQAQQDLKMLQGLRATFYCGAYTRYGFHEDGLLSAVQVSEALGEKVVYA